MPDGSRRIRTRELYVVMVIERLNDEEVNREHAHVASRLFPEAVVGEHDVEIRNRRAR